MLAGYLKWVYPQKSKYFSKVKRKKGFVRNVPAVPFGK